MSTRVLFDPERDSTNGPVLKVIGLPQIHISNTCLGPDGIFVLGVRYRTPVLWKLAFDGDSSQQNLLSTYLGEMLQQYDAEPTLRSEPVNNFETLSSLI